MNKIILIKLIKKKEKIQLEQIIIPFFHMNNLI